MDDQSSLICSIKTGKITINLKCPSLEYANGIREYFNTKGEGEQGIREYVNAGEHGEFGIEINLQITAENGDIRIPESLFTAKSVHDNNFTITNKCAKGYFDPGTGKGLIQVHYLLTSSIRTRLFEQLLYQAFYSASKRSHYNALLIHSCGIKRKDYGFLFVGKAGSGKSTIAELSKEYTVLNDEIMLIELDKDKPVMHSTPFNGYFKGKTGGSAELKAIFFLEHADTHRVSTEKKSTAVKALFREIVPVIGLEEEITPETHTVMLDYAAVIVQKTPVYRLGFLPDPGFWEEIYKKITADGVC